MFLGLRQALRHVIDTLAGWPRRLAALCCLLLAAVTALSSGGNRSKLSAEPVVIAARDLAAGQLLGSADTRVVNWPAELVPSSAVRAATELTGKTIAARMVRGEPITSTRLLDTAITAALRPGQVAVTVSLADRGQRAVLGAGSLIDLYAASAVDYAARASANPNASRVADNLRVLAVLPSTQHADRELTLVLAADPAVASRLANQTSATLIATLRPP
jgi:Flp pilus assembly protein CpaB